MKVPSIYLVCLFIGIAFALGPNWRLAWNDEFNTLNTANWNIRNRAGNYGNGEQQWYHPNQSTVVNGSLVISAINTPFGGESYMSGWLDSMDKAYFTYGHYEIRAKMSNGTGLWPALWLLSQTGCWALGSEVDIAEFRGSYPTQIGMYYHYATGCCAIYGSCISSTGQAYTTSTDLTQDYHVYAVEWFPTNTTWYLDGVVMGSYLADQLITEQDPSPHYWIMNAAVGGGYPGYPTSSNVWPSNLYVDYVRNYVYRATCTGETCSGHGCCNPSTFLCVCNSGWAGTYCEASVATYTNNFAQLTNMDNVPNGWGNDQTLYLTANAVVSTTTGGRGRPSTSYLKLMLTSAGCPGNCGNDAYSSGAWESIPRFTYGKFSFVAKGPTTAGTGFSLSAAGESTTSLEQFSWVLEGGSETAALWTWHNNWNYQVCSVNLGFDHSRAYHTYNVTYSATNLLWYVDSVLVCNSTANMPIGPFSFGAYYTAETAWYGAFQYPGPTYVYLQQAAWSITPIFTATC